MKGRLLDLFLFSVLPLASLAFQTTNNVIRPSRAPGAVSAVKPKMAKSSTTRLASTANKEIDEKEAVQVDYDALLKYHGAIAIQMTLFCASLAALDALVDATGVTVPFPVIMILFYVLSLKSRIFNPLNNARPNVPVQDGDGQVPPSAGFGDRVMPSWTPPGVVFPIMWLLIIGPIRAYTSALVVEASGGHFFTPAILAFLFHLSVGDVWNTINNTEQRYGASVTGVLCVVASLLNAAYMYHGVMPLAGNLMGLVVIWLSVATCLITATWQLNPNPATGEKYPLYPTVGDKKTEFMWFQSNEY